MAIAAAVYAALLGLGLVSFVLFHTFAEIAFITVSFCVFAVAITLREFLDDDFPVFVGTALLAVGVLQVLHLLDYPGVGLITGSTDPPTQLWVSTSLMTAISLIIAPFVLGRRISIRTTMAAYGVVVALVVCAVFWWQIFPATLVEGQGLTTFKRVSEYAVSGLLIVAGGVVYARRDRFKPRVFALMIAALAARVISSLFFAVYAGPHTWPNLVGHLWLLLFAMLIYQAVVQDSLTQPHALAVANLELTAVAARAAQREAEAMRETFDQLLGLTLAFHEEQDLAGANARSCSAARELLGCDIAALFDVEANMLMPAAVDSAGRLRRAERTSYAETSALAAQLSERRPVFVTCPDVCAGCFGVANPGACPFRSQLGIRSMVRVPLGVGHRADGLLVLGWLGEVDEPDARMLALVQRFGDQVQSARTTARSREAQNRADELHRRFERSLLPKFAGRQAEHQVCMHYQPGETRLELGGDFIDVVAEDGRIAVIVGDVCGRGADAAALGATLRSAWAALVLDGAPLTRIAATLEQVVEKERGAPELFATVQLATVDTERDELALLTYGHPLPFVCTSSSVSLVTASPMPPLGSFEVPPQPPVTVPLPSGWSLFFYTDGLVEGRMLTGAGERFGEQRLRASLVEVGGVFTGEDDLRRLFRVIAASGVEPAVDDVTALVVTQRRRAG